MSEKQPKCLHESANNIVTLIGEQTGTRMRYSDLCSRSKWLYHHHKKKKKKKTQTQQQQKNPTTPKKDKKVLESCQEKKFVVSTHQQKNQIAVAIP